jgi:predicted HAD superfamily phosphohydrolase YqeG
MDKKIKFSSNLKRIKEKIKRKEIAVGTHIKIGDQMLTDILCNCGYNIVWNEHGKYNI